MDQVDERTETALGLACKNGWKAARRHRVPGIIMWLLGVGIIAGYYHVPAIHHFLEAIGQIKQEWGWRFSLVSTAISGGLIPALVSMTLVSTDAQSDRKPNSPFELLFASTLLWGYKGVEIDYFYQFQAWLFGDQANLLTVISKTACDQFIMVPIMGMVNVVLFYHWRDCGYSLSLAVAKLGKGWYAKMVLPALIANWFIWIPAVAMIYCLPSALQLPVQNLILCFWVLVLLVFTHDNSEGLSAVDEN